MAEDKKSAFLQAAGEHISRELNAQLGRYGVQQRGPVLRDTRSETAKAGAPLEERFRSACRLMPSDAIDDLIASWWQPASLVPSRQQSHRSPGNATGTQGMHAQQVRTE
jgi:hypothetical protein